MCAEIVGSERCYAGRGEIVNTAAAAGGIDAIAVDWEPTDPCVVDGLAYHPVWLFQDLDDLSAPKIEIGIGKTTTKNEIYSCCLNCGLTDKKRCEWHGAAHLEGSPTWVQVEFDGPTDTWYWYINGQYVRHVTYEGFDYAEALALGGETDYWQNDIGVLGHLTPRYMRVNERTWHEFTPFDTRNPGKNYNQRYWQLYRASKYIQVLTDHAVFGLEPACGWQS